MDISSVLLNIFEEINLWVLLYFTVFLPTVTLFFFKYDLSYRNICAVDGDSDSSEERSSSGDDSSEEETGSSDCDSSGSDEEDSGLSDDDYNDDDSNENNNDDDNEENNKKDEDDDIKKVKASRDARKNNIKLYDDDENYIVTGAETIVNLTNRVISILSDSDSVRVKKLRNILEQVNACAQDVAVNGDFVEEDTIYKAKDIICEFSDLINKNPSESDIILEKLESITRS